MLKTILTLHLLSALLISAWAHNAAGAPAGNMYSRKDLSIGQEMYDKMVEDGIFYEDVELQAYITKVGQRLVAQSEMADEKFTFSIIDNDAINAFATPGGFIYINRGLLAHLNNESELAGVLSHEIAHVTSRHSARQQRANITNKVLATALGIITGSRGVMDSAGLYGAELVRGYGREHELEADTRGAIYMHKAGYNADALLEVIGALKNHEQYQRRLARESGKTTATYHGLYATHPRNDLRLQQAIASASELELTEWTEDPEVPGEFRHHLQELPWGMSGRALRSDKRFYHNKLAFTFEKPEGWTTTTSGSQIVISSTEGDKVMTLTIQKQNRKITVAEALKDKVTDLADGEDWEKTKLKGYTGTQGGRRLAAINYNGLTYFLVGTTSGSATLANADEDFLKIVKSFRPMGKNEIKKGKARAIHWIQAPRGTTFAKLATSVPIDNAEIILRLINGYYPRGEPRTADWIKVIR